MNMTELYRGCRTYRRFTQERVPQEVLQEMKTNVRMASCGRNAQVLRYTFVSSVEMVEKMQPLVKWAGSLPPELGYPKEGEKPKAFVVISAVAEASVLNSIDVGLAADTLVTTAWAHGVGSCMIISANMPAVKELLQLPEEETPRLVIALGYPSHKSTIVDVSVGDSITYYLDENKDYYVPKYRVEEITRSL